MRSHRAGMTLAVTLMAIACAVVFALALADVSISHLRLATRVENRFHARCLAESAVAQALYQVEEDSTYGADGQRLVVPAEEGPAGAEGVVTFSVGDTADNQPISYSTNNLANDSSVRGDGGALVPGQSVRLVGTGLWNNETDVVDATVHIPRFPFSIASSGPVNGTRLVVGAVNNLPAAGAVLNESKLLPADIGSNAVGPGAIHLGAGSTIYGDAVAVGGIGVDPGAVVKGKTKPGAGAISIPTISMPDLSGRSGLVTLGGGDDRPILSGFSNAPGDYTANGGLTLDGGVLTVHGDLTVTGPVTGTGAIFVSGKTNITVGGSTFAADQTVAIASKGDVTISGSGKSESVFEGVVYTQGNFSATNIALVGAFVANGSGKAGSTEVGSMTLTDADMVQGPVKGTITVTAGDGKVAQLGGSGNFRTFPSPGAGSGQVIFLPTNGANHQWYRLTQAADGSWTPAGGPYSDSDLPAAMQPYVVAWLQSQGQPTDPADVADVTAGYVSYVQSSRSAITQFTSASGTTTGSTGSGPPFALDLNPFLSEAGGVKLLLWVDLGATH